MEFSFDVVQVAAGAYAPEAYHSYIGFKVAKPALERAFRETYGIEMKDVFLNEDLAIATYRHAVGTTIPEMTKVAWGKKRDEIMKVDARRCSGRRSSSTCRAGSTTRSSDGDYAKPHGFARFLALVYGLVPKIGPFRSLGFSVPTAEAERLFLESFVRARERFRQSLEPCEPAGCSCRTLISIRGGRRRKASMRWPTRRTTNCWTRSPAAGSPASRPC